MMSKIPLFSGIGAAVVGVIVLIIFSPSGIAQEEYAISVDPTKEKQSLFIMARVSIENIGSKPLTNIEMNFGDGDKIKIGILKPGQSEIISPPQGNSLQYVIVTSEEGVYVSKVYREPIAMPGMMGS
tara:strand:- start:1131 stop:1511 length:381 start_codon:yes stop_codon:yes gene_type:complete